jgi:Flp pilus assembly pilin Flp
MNKIAFTLYFWQLSFVDATVDRIKARREAGQGTLEYVGMIAVAAIVIVAVIGALKTADLKHFVSDAVTKVTSALGA